MASNADKCGSCGSDLEQESGSMVCTGCGQVFNSAIHLADDPNQTYGNNDNQRFRRQTINSSVRNRLVADLKTTPTRQMGIRLAETLALNYNFNSDMKTYLMSYYNKAINHKNFYYCSLKNKEILAAVCAYITLMNHNESIAIQYVCSAIGCNGFEFGQMYTLFVNTFPVCKPEVKPIEELVPSVLNDFRIEKQEVNELKDRVIDIISIEKACWLVDGRSPLHLITGATYLGWKSIRPLERARVKFTHFCKEFGIRYAITTVDRIKEMNDVFIKLAQHIPIVKHRKIRIHKNNIALYMNDIIKYPNSLIFDLRRDVYRKLCETQQKFTEMSANEEDINEENDRQWMNSFNRKVYFDKVGQKELNSSEKKVEVEEEENEEPDISDNEINSYLRSDKELKIYKKLRKRAKRLNAIESNGNRLTKK